MKILKEVDGKQVEVKGAKVFYEGHSGAPMYVQVDGVNYSPNAFTLEGPSENVVKKGDVMSTDNLEEVEQTEEETANDSVLSTADVEAPKKKRLSRKRK